MRSIIWSEDFSRQVDRAGGARLVDEALEPILDGLRHNPRGFKLVETDYTSFRYARTNALPDKLGALIVVFTIDKEKNVVLEWFDEDIPF